MTIPKTRPTTFCTQNRNSDANKVPRKRTTSYCDRKEQHHKNHNVKPSRPPDNDHWEALIAT